jgi:cell division protein FtsZ
LLNVTGSSNLTMQEINEGNNVIFEAAGEEANVIFGCVRKEDMNDYVSYTVIATGFDGAQKIYSAKTAKTQNTQPKDADIFRGGFSFLENKDVDTEDLDVPTILRVKSPKSTLETKDLNEDELPKSGFKFDDARYNWNKDRKEKANVEKDDKDDEDSSSFLRMIMD